MPLGCFGVPARYQRVAGPAHCIFGRGCRPGGEPPLSHSQNLPIPVAGQRCIHLEDPLVHRGRAVTLPALISFSTCTASWHLSDWDVPKGDFSKGSCWVCLSFLGCDDHRVCSPFLLEVTDRCFAHKTDERWHPAGLLSTSAISVSRVTTRSSIIRAFFPCQLTRGHTGQAPIHSCDVATLWDNFANYYF